MQMGNYHYFDKFWHEFLDNLLQKFRLSRMDFQYIKNFYNTANPCYRRDIVQTKCNLYNITAQSGFQI